MDSKTFFIYVVICKQEKMAINLVLKAQIRAQTGVEAQVRALIFDRASIVILSKYFNYNNIFLMKNATKILEHTRINGHAIKLKKDK